MAYTQWASGWLAFKRKAANAYSGLDFNFDIPSDEEAEESFSVDCSGEPNCKPLVSIYNLLVLKDGLER